MGNDVGSDSVSALGKRQDAIFTRLDGLKQKLEGLKGKYQVSTPVTSSQPTRQSVPTTGNQSIAGSANGIPLVRLV